MKYDLMSHFGYISFHSRLVREF